MGMDFPQPPSLDRWRDKVRPGCTPIVVQDHREPERWHLMGGFNERDRSIDYYRHQEKDWNPWYPYPVDLFLSPDERDLNAALQREAQRQGLLRMDVVRQVLAAVSVQHLQRQDTELGQLLFPVARHVGMDALGLARLLNGNTNAMAFLKRLCATP